jgi:hypothetical protein
MQTDSATLAESWLRDQLKPLTRGDGQSTVTADQEYGHDYTGLMQGGFQIAAPAPPIVYPTRIQVLSPDPIPSNYSGTISGTVRDKTSTENLRVDAYLLADTYYLQAQLPVDATGGWSHEAVGRGGDWRFRLINLATGAQIGEEWQQQLNAGAYEDTAVQLYTVTDTEYLQASTHAPANNRWSLSVSRAGSKLIKLVNTGTGAEYARWASRTGMIRSYTIEPGDEAYNTSFEHRSYVYDQAVGILAFLQRGQVATAQEMGVGLTRIQDSGGAFPFSVHQLSTQGADPYFRTGAVAWVAYALLRLAATPGVDQADLFRTSARKCLQYIASLQSPQWGLVRGGSGKYLADGTFDPTYTVTWHSTEHNIDAWFAFRAGWEVLTDAGFRDAALRVQRGLQERGWSFDERRFWHGVGSEGSPDTAGALDVHSWGGLLLHAWAMEEGVEDVLARAERYYRTVDSTTGRVGYKPYAPEEGYPEAVDTVWLEGSFGVLLARRRAGLDVSVLERDLPAWQLANGSFRYAALRDERYEISTRPAVASTGWFLLSDVQSVLWTERDPDGGRPVRATASPFYADPFGEQNSTGRIRQAVARAAANAQAGTWPRRVYLSPGTYRCTETLVLPRDLSLTGVPGETVLDCSGLTSGTAVQWGSPAVSGSPEEGVVRGITVLNPDGTRTALSM